MTAAAAKAVSEFLGITNEECPVDCRHGHCVITGDGHCGHPRKGGIQAKHHGEPETVDRYNRARKHLALAAVDQKDWSR